MISELLCGRELYGDLFGSFFPSSYRYFSSLSTPGYRLIIDHIVHTFDDIEEECEFWRGFLVDIREAGSTSLLGSVSILLCYLCLACTRETLIRLLEDRSEMLYTL